MKIFLIKGNIKRDKKIISIFAISFLFIFIFFSQIYKGEALFNKQINYQGKLTTSAYIAVANGTYNMEFKLYTASTGGSTLWTETRTGASKVQVTNGLFSVMLGEVNSLTGVDFNQTPIYLGVNIGGTGTPGWDGEMTPRKLLGTVPSSIEASKSLISNNLVGGNSTTLLGSIPYQSDTDITTLLSPNTTATKKFFSMTGTGTNGSAPIWSGILDADLPSAFTSKTYNGLTVTSLATGFTIAGGTTSKTLTVPLDASVSGTNTGDNSVNTTYANDYRLANFIAGTNYLAPNGSAAALTSFPTFNQNTTGTAANISGGLGGQILYQSAVDTTAKLSNGTAGQILTSRGTTLAPSWTTAPIKIVNTSNLFSNLSGTGNGVTTVTNSNFFGVSAGFSATSASNSNFIGGGSGYSATSASNSNFIGNSSGSYATNASYSNFIGDNVGGDATNASYSNFMGSFAGNGSSNASYSNLFGFSAGEFFSGNNIGSNNIIIGTNISLPNATANAINLGGVIFAKNTYSTITGNPSIIPTTNGSVGIGVVSPTARLQLAAGTIAAGTAPLKFTSGPLLTTGEAGAVEFLNDAYYGTITTGNVRKQFAFTDALTSYIPYTGGTSNVDLGIHNLTVDTNSLFVDSVNHRVGIGTISPSYKLDVYGTGANDGIRTNIGLDLSYVSSPLSGDYSVALINTSTGNVDPGAHIYVVSYTTSLGETATETYGHVVTNDATHKQVTVNLPISTDSRVTGRKIYRTIADGYYYNTFLLATINDNTTTTYTDNIADASLGMSNSGFAKINTTNKAITINGTSAMIIDPNMTSLGVQSGSNITSGWGNTFLGFQTGASTTTGGQNVYFGTNAGTYNISGSNNIAIGASALASDNADSDNIAIGRNALVYSNSGADNVVIGSFAASNNNASSSNTIIGGHAFSGATLGGYINNTALGNEAGYNNSASNNVFIGYQSGFYETGANKLFIDNQQRASESDARIKAMMYGVFSATPSSQYLTINGNVGIGVLSPTASLQLEAGTATAGTAPVKLTSGVNLGIAEAGAMEYDGTNLYFTPVTTRKTFAFTDSNITGNSAGFSGSLAGDVTGTQGATTISSSVVTGKLITGYASGIGTVSATDTILQAINKLNGNDSVKIPYTGGTSNVDLGIHNLTVDTNSLFVDSVNHRVGIGTIIPTDKLTVTNSSTGVSATALRLENNFSTVGTASSLDFDVAGSVAVTGRISNILESDATRSLIFSGYNGGIQEGMRLLGNGNLGIGIAIPSAYLNIKASTGGASTAPIKLTSGTNLVTTEAGAVEYDGTHLYFTAVNAGARYQLDQQNSMVYPGSGIPNSTGSAWGTSYSTSGSGIVLALTTTPTFTTNITTPLVIGGTSTTSPLTFQTTSGVGAAGADMHFKVGNNGGTESMTILNNGNVGINQINPQAILDVGGAVLINGMATGQGIVGIKQTLNTNSGGLTLYNSSSSGSARWWIDSSAIMRLDNTASANSQIVFNGAGTGRVGIGIVAPTASLHLRAGSAVVNTAPLKFTSGPVLGTTEAGAVEYDGTHLYFTAVNAGARYQLDQTPWDIIGDPTGNGSIAFGSTVQTMDWATATTTNPLSMTASALTTGKLLSLSSNTLTSGTLLDISSNGTGGLTNQKGLNVSLSGTNGTALQTTYGVYISNAHAGTTSTNIGIYATATGGTTTNWAGQFVVAGATSIVARFTNGTGSCDINPTTTALVCASDINLKKNIVTMDDKEFALQTVPDITSMSIKDKLMLLTPVKYNWKSEQDTDGKHAGFIAQEIEQIFPDLVFTDPTTGLKSVAFTNLIPYTIEAFKEMNLKITELNNMDKKNDWRDSLSAWFGNASNKITRIFTGEICLSDENGETECINRSQLKSLKNLINISNTASVLPPVDNTINTPVPEITVPITEPTVTQAPIEVPIMEPSVTEVSTPTTNTTPVL